MQLKSLYLSFNTLCTSLILIFLENIELILKHPTHPDKLYINEFLLGQVIKSEFKPFNIWHFTALSTWLLLGIQLSFAKLEILQVYWFDWDNFFRMLIEFESLISKICELR